MADSSSSAATATAPPALLEVSDLVKDYRVRSRQLARSPATLRAVDGVSFRVGAGETLGLVGESGGGKTTVGLSVLRLIRPSGGSVSFEGRDVLAAGRTEMKALRQRMQIVFQDPIGALDPRKTVGESVGEGLRIQGLASRAESRLRADEVLDRVGLTAAQARSLPHELSGGQLQRVGIARALALDPRLVVCDEPVSALDVSIQAQIIKPAAGPAGRAGPRLPVHCPRPGSGAPHLGPGRGHVSRPHRRVGARRRPVRQSCSSLHPSPAVGCAGGQPGDGQSAHRAARRDPQRHRAAERMPLRPQMPRRDGPVQRGDAGVQGSGARALGRLLPQRLMSSTGISGELCGLSAQNQPEILRAVGHWNLG